jgi:hypothetical protein
LSLLLCCCYVLLYCGCYIVAMLLLAVGRSHVVVGNGVPRRDGQNRAHNV